MLATPERRKRITPTVMATLMLIALAMWPIFGMRSMSGMQMMTAPAIAMTDPSFFSSQSAKKYPINMARVCNDTMVDTMLRAMCK